MHWSRVIQYLPRHKEHSYHVAFWRCKVVTICPKTQAVGSPLISPLWPIIQYFNKYFPHLQVILLVPSIPCSGDRDTVDVACVLWYLKWMINCPIQTFTAYVGLYKNSLYFSISLILFIKYHIIATYCFMWKFISTGTTTWLNIFYSIPESFFSWRSRFWFLEAYWPFVWTTE